MEPILTGWRRIRLEPNRRTAALSTDRLRFGALSRQAPTSALAVGAQPQAAISGRAGGDDGWRATAPALCRWRRSTRCLAPRPPRRPSKLAVARSREAQQHRNFFWISMIASARSNRCFRRRLSRRESASSAANGFGQRFWGRAWLLSGAVLAGSASISVQTLALQWRHPCPKQVNAGTAIHGPLERGPAQDWGSGCDRRWRG